MTDVAPASPEIRLGVAGITEGNGHPYSFASIVNGYDRAAYDRTEWGGILDYLAERDRSEFGFPGVAVTHAWTQDPAATERLCAAARIPTAAEELTELTALDGVLLLRDDHERHWEMAQPFLDADTPVFIDKPLTMDPAELAAFEPHVRDGTVRSCSGLRFARELDGPRSRLTEYGPLRLVSGTVVYDWPRYGVHVLEAVLNTIDTRPVAVTAPAADHVAVRIETAAGYPVQIDALGEVPVTFDVAIYGRERTSRHQLRDNFTAFRRTLARVVAGIRTGEPSMSPETTLDVIRTLIAGHRARAEDRRVELAEVAASPTDE
jgi:predicted dehydrogenase